MVPVVALKVADLAAAATLADVGTVRAGWLLDRVTFAPPVGAGWVRVTVQVLEEFGPSELGLHTSDDISEGATRLTLAVAELLL
jgi:hypothetical protein